MLGLSAKCWVSNSSTTIETRMNIRTTPKVVRNALSMLYLSVCPPPSLSLKPHRQPGMGAQAKLFGISPPLRLWLVIQPVVILSGTGASLLATRPRPHNCFGILLWLVDSCMTFCGCTHRMDSPNDSSNSYDSSDRSDSWDSSAPVLSCPVLLGGVNNNQRAGLATGPAINCHGLASNYVTAQK